MVVINEVQHATAEKKNHAKIFKRIACITQGGLLEQIGPNITELNAILFKQRAVKKFKLRIQ